MIGDEIGDAIGNEGRSRFSIFDDQDLLEKAAVPDLVPDPDFS